MGKICSFNCMDNEKNEEFNGFNRNNINQKEYYIIIKKQFQNYEHKDQKYYTKTPDYDNLIENTSIQDIQFENEPIENEEGTVKIIHY